MIRARLQQDPGALATEALPSARRGGGAGLRGRQLDPMAFVAGGLLAGLPPLLYVYMPRPPLPGSHFLVYPAMAGLLAILTALFLRERPAASREVVGWLFLLLLYSVVTGLSLLVNASELRGSAPAELFKPPVYGVFLAYGYVVGRKFGAETVTRGLVWAALLILLGQTLLAATQAAGLPVFSFVYQSDKSHPFGLLLRVTGSLGNPNAFAWMIAQAAVIVSLMHGRSRRSLWLGLATLLVLLSGSRTLLLLFPFMIATAQVLRDPTNLRTYARYLALAAGLLGLFVAVILFLGDYFPYLAQLKMIAASGSLASVSSFAHRLAMWSGGYAEFTGGGVLSWLVGLGSRDSTAVMDNDYLYVFFRLGAVGAAVHFTIIITALVRFLRARSSVVAVFGAEYVIFALVFGLVSESTASWHLPLILFAVLGTVIGMQEPVRGTSGERRRPQVDSVPGVPA